MGSDGLRMRMFSFVLLLSMGAVGSGAAQTGGGSAVQQIQVHEQRAHQLLSQNKPELAVKEFAAVVALDVNNIDAQANLGVLLFFQQRYEQAEPHLQKAVHAQPDLAKDHEHAADTFVTEIHFVKAENSKRKGQIEFDLGLE